MIEPSSTVSLCACVCVCVCVYNYWHSSWYNHSWLAFLLFPRFQRMKYLIKSVIYLTKPIVQIAVIVTNTAVAAAYTAKRQVKRREGGTKLSLFQALRLKVLSKNTKSFRTHRSDFWMRDAFLPNTTGKHLSLPLEGRLVFACGTPCLSLSLSHTHLLILMAFQLSLGVQQDLIYIQCRHSLRKPFDSLIRARAAKLYFATKLIWIIIVGLYKKEFIFCLRPVDYVNNTNNCIRDKYTSYFLRLSLLNSWFSCLKRGRDSFHV